MKTFFYLLSLKFWLCGVTHTAESKEVFELCDQISRQNQKWIKKYFSLFIRGPDGFESSKKWRSNILWLKHLVTPENPNLSTVNISIQEDDAAPEMAAAAHAGHPPCLFKLPDFWTASPAAWLGVVEGQFCPGRRTSRGNSAILLSKPMTSCMSLVWATWWPTPSTDPQQVRPSNHSWLACVPSHLRQSSLIASPQVSHIGWNGRWGNCWAWFDRFAPFGPLVARRQCQ